MNANVPERLWQMTRVEAGDYLLPSNDGATLWRIVRYLEDGSASFGDGTVIRGEWWALYRWRFPFNSAPSVVASRFDLEAWDDFQYFAGPFAKRSEAVAEALLADA